MKKIMFFCFFSVFMWPFLLWAQELNETLPVVEVHGEALLRSELQSTSSGVLTNEDLQNRVYVTPLDMLTQIPGLNVLNYMEGGIPTMMHMRGFSGSHTGGMAFYLDGTQLNEPTGGADTNIINTIEIDHVDVVKGPVSAIYGNYAQGGTISYYTIKSGDLARFIARAGSFSTVEGQGIFGKTGEFVDQIYAFGVYHTDGYRNSSDWDKYNLSARYTFHPGEKLTSTLGFRFYNSEWNSAGYTPIEWGRKANIDDGSGQYGGGKRTYKSIHLDTNYSITDEHKINVNAFYNTRETVRFFPNVPYISSTQIAPPNGTVSSGSGTFADIDIWGISAAYQFDGLIGNRKFIFEAGVVLVDESTHSRSYPTMWGTGRKIYRQSANSVYDRQIKSVYAEGNYQVLEPLMVRLGARYDVASGNIDSWTTGKVKSPNRHAFSPKFGVLYTPIPEQLEIYLNASRGFAFPSASGVFYTDPSQENTIRDQYEIGFRSMPFDWFEGGMAYYRFYTSNDLSYDRVLERSVNIGKTLRTGLETYVNLYPWPDWQIHLDYTYQTAKYVENKSSSVSRNGQRIAEIPRHITNIEVSYSPSIGLGGRVKYNWNADAFYAMGFDGLPISNQDYGRLDVQLNYRFNEKYLISLDVLNVLDKEYYGILGNWGSYYTQTRGKLLASHQNPIAAYLTLSIDLK